MHRAWGVVATVAAASGLAALPFLLFETGLELGGLPMQVLVWALPAACALLGGCLGWWSRPRWLALPLLLVGVVVAVASVAAMSEPGRSDFCEGFTPTQAAAFGGVFLVWPWQALGVATGSLLAHVARRAQGLAAAGEPHAWRKETASLALYIVGGLALAWLLVGFLQ